MNLFTRSVPSKGGYRGQVVLALPASGDMLRRDVVTPAREIVVWESDVWDHAPDAKDEADEALTDVLTGLFKE